MPEKTSAAHAEKPVNSTSFSEKNFSVPKNAFPKNFTAASAENFPGTNSIISPTSTAEPLIIVNPVFKKPHAVLPAKVPIGTIPAINYAKIAKTG